jgi:outer membrane protein
MLSLCLLALLGAPTQLATPPELRRSLSLEEALALADEHDARLSVSRLDEGIAGFAAQRELALVLPSVQLGAVATRNPREIQINDRVVSPLVQPVGTLTSRLTIFRGSSIPGALAGFSEYGAVRAEQGEARDSLRADVASLFLVLAEARAIEEALARAVTVGEELVRLAEARVRFDEAVALEVDEARAELLRTTADLERTRGARREVAALLALRLGIEPTDSLDATCVECIEPPPLPGGPFVELPLPHRGDLLGQRLRADAAGMRALGGWLDLLPSVDVVGNVRLQEPTLFNPDFVWWTAQVVLSWDLFRGTGGYAFARQQTTLDRRAGAVATLATREAEVQVEQARVALEASRAAERASLGRAEVAGRALEQARLRYREGLLASLGVSEAARRKADADALAVQGRFDVYRAALRLRRALGFGVLDEGEEHG